MYKQLNQQSVLLPRLDWSHTSIASLNEYSDMYNKWLWDYSTSFNSYHIFPQNHNIFKFSPYSKCRSISTKNNITLFYFPISLSEEIEKSSYKSMFCINIYITSFSKTAALTIFLAKRFILMFCSIYSITIHRDFTLSELTKKQIINTC